MVLVQNSANILGQEVPVRASSSSPCFWIESNATSQTGSRVPITPLPPYSGAVTTISSAYKQDVTPFSHIKNPLAAIYARFLWTLSCLAIFSTLYINYEIMQFCYSIIFHILRIR